jgi:hypothetical protein
MREVNFGGIQQRIAEFPQQIGLPNPQCIVIIGE